MTQPMPEHQAPYAVTPAANSKLEQLQALYPAAKAKADAAAADLKQITDGIKAELVAAAPGQTRIALVGSAGPSLGLTYSESWSVDAKRLKAEAPKIYVAFAKKSSRWSLGAIKGGE